MPRDTNENNQVVGKSSTRQAIASKQDARCKRNVKMTSDSHNKSASKRNFKRFDYRYLEVPVPVQGLTSACTSIHRCYRCGTP